MSLSSTACRREFLRATGAAVASTIIPASALGRHKITAPSDRISLGIVGLGSRGYNLIDQFLRESDAQLVAACDVDRMHYRDRVWGSGTAHGRDPGKKRIEDGYAKQSDRELYRGVDVYADYREILDRDDIDAVVIATPDHWHALMAIDAMRAAKDVYCEKPLAHSFAEGQAMCLAAFQEKAVFQTGSQQRSDAKFRHAVRLVLNGHLGQIDRVEVGLPAGYAEPQGDTAVVDPPEPLDYDFWCGPAEKLPYMRARHHRWWRGHRAFGGGVLMDWIGHHNDIAQWALGMDQSGPETVDAVEWTYPHTDVYNTPHQYEIRCGYAGGIITSISTRYRGGIKWIGTDGWLFATRGKLEASDPRLVASDFNPGSIDVYHSPSHTRNFLDCVRSRKACISPPQITLRSIPAGAAWLRQ